MVKLKHFYKELLMIFSSDTYILKNSTNDLITIETHNLIFETYKLNAFKRHKKFYKTQYIDVEDGFKDHYLSYITYFLFA